MKINPYLNFQGKAEEAMTFYAEALGGKLTEIHRFSSMPNAADLPEAARNLVMHVGVELPNGLTLMASDTMEGFGPPFVAGTNMSISVHPASKEDADRFFGALSEGGEVTMPLEDQFWGDYYGACTDRFGVQWMINYNAATA